MSTSGAGRIITIDDNLQGGLTLSASGVRNGLLAAVEIGLVGREAASEILLLIREATEQLISTMNR